MGTRRSVKRLSKSRRDFLRSGLALVPAALTATLAAAQVARRSSDTAAEQATTAI